MSWLRKQHKDNDIQLLLAVKAHIGTSNTTEQMKRYVSGRKQDEALIINLGKTWESYH